MHVLVVQDGRELTVRRLYASKSARTEENASRRTRASASTAGSTRIARRPFVRRRAATAATVPGLIPVRARRNGVEKTAEHPYVNRNARTAVGASRRTRANVPRNGTATTAVCRSATRANLKLMARRKRDLEYQKAIPRSVWISDQEHGPCTGLASSRSGATRRKASIVRNRNGPIRSWRPSPVRTICM